MEKPEMCFPGDKPGPGALFTPTISLPNQLEKYRLRVGLKVFNITNHFNPRDFQNNLASANFGGFYNGVGRMFAMKFVIEKK